ncbi:hypothetical protein OMY_01391 [Enterococcus sulfureus ATCC 49903]|uniref:Phage replication protein n=1 Tax=Enterococcus sulfureus ATCC 49903 TaxID=1140003 RepID=S0L4B3_9ENTE|nr:hypothetical protein [Enterococcus sulfureus]EOT47138.1 hypothetical protein OMY_01391 [Enterococcus sulfureus ATCC 49903]EOT83567.1 hypothetical protein I573_01289 [Enterococcus sulfureus ATCC 49903]
MAELNIRQEKFMNALLETASMEAASKKAGISRQTGYKYMKDPVFLAAYRSLRRDAMQQVTESLRKASLEAVVVLKEVMNNSEAPASSRVSSARNVLDLTYRAFELDDLAEEIDKIKEQLEDV